MPPRKAAPVYYPAGNAYRRLYCRRRSSLARLRGRAYRHYARIDSGKR